MAPSPSHWRRYRELYALLVVCIAPVVASYLAYYVFQPSGRTNYGQLIEPQRPLPALRLTALDGTPVDPASLRGQWLMLQADAGACAADCQKKLWLMRQVRLTQGREADRITRVFLVTDDAPVDAALLREYDGTLFLRITRTEAAAWLDTGAAGATLEAPIWLADPLGNLMLRWPAAPDPSRVKRDLGKVLKASRIG